MKMMRLNLYFILLILSTKIRFVFGKVRLSILMAPNIRVSGRMISNMAKAQKQIKITFQDLANGKREKTPLTEIK